MPCIDHAPTAAEIAFETMNRLACERCRWYDKIFGNVPLWARAWWEAQQETDHARAAKKCAEQLAQEQRDAALDKLTPAEQRVLGVTPS